MRLFLKRRITYEQEESSCEQFLNAISGVCLREKYESECVLEGEN